MAIKETELYAPVKAYLSAQGYEVKGEVAMADIVAMPCNSPSGGEPLIVELKTSFSLTLFHQAISRQSMSDQVYIAAPRKKGKAAFTAIKRNKMLCRRLGLGMMTVNMKDGRVVVHCEPAPFTPRKNKAKKTRLVAEFETRHGDPNKGGMTGEMQMTAYRQGALRCAKVLYDEGACKASYVAKMAGFEKARALMASNHYGWFEKVERGIYGLTAEGAKALDDNAALVRSMMES